MRRLTLTSILLAGCATMGAPPGGPEDNSPPRIIARTPAADASDSTVKSITVTFDEVITEPPRMGRGGGPSGLAQYVILSPDAGPLKVEWHRESMTIEPARGFRPHTAYRVTILPGISDLRAHPVKEVSTWVFSTGSASAPYAIRGRIFDWTSQQPVPLAVIQAVMRVSATDSLVYTGVSDSTGEFSVGPVSSGRFDVRGFIDVNNNRLRDSTEKWDAVTLGEQGFNQPIELLAIERDTLPPDIANASVVDSISIRVHFDRPLDPMQMLQPALVRVQRADSTEIIATEVLSEARDTERRVAIGLAVADSINNAYADSVARATGIPRPPRTAAPPPTAPTGPAPIKPRSAAPITTIVIRLPMSAKIAPDETIRITTRGFRGLTGASKTSNTTVKRPR